MGRVLAALAPAVLLAVDPWGWYPFGPIKWLLATTLGARRRRAGADPRVACGCPARSPAALVGFVARPWPPRWGRTRSTPGPARLRAPPRGAHLGQLRCCWLTGTALSERTGALVDGLVVAGPRGRRGGDGRGLGWEPAVLDVADRLSGSGDLPGLALGAGAPCSSRSAWPPPSAPGGGRQGLATGLLSGDAGLGSGARRMGGAGRRRPLCSSPPRWRDAASPSRARAWAARRVGVAVPPLRSSWCCSPLGAIAGTPPTPMRPAAGVASTSARRRARGHRPPPHPVRRPEGYRTAFEDGVDDRYERFHGRAPAAGSAPTRARSTWRSRRALLAAWAAILAVVARAAWRALRRGPTWQQGIAAALIAHWVGLSCSCSRSWSSSPSPGSSPASSSPPPPVRPLGDPVPLVLAWNARPLGRGTRARTRGVVVPSLVGVGLGVLRLGGGAGGGDRRGGGPPGDRAVDALERGDAHAAARGRRCRGGPAARHRATAPAGRPAAVADERGPRRAAAGRRRARGVAPDPIARRERLRLLVQRAESTRTRAHLQLAREELRTAPARMTRTPPSSGASTPACPGRGGRGRCGRAAARADELTPPEDRVNVGTDRVRGAWIGMQATPRTVAIPIPVWPTAHEPTAPRPIEPPVLEPIAPVPAELVPEMTDDVGRTFDEFYAATRPDIARALAIRN